MKKRRNKDDTVEKLEKEIRELKSLNRTLMRRLKKTDRHYKEIEDEIEEQSSTEDIEKFYKPTKQVSTVCPNCSRNELESITVVNRAFQKCANCGWRSKAEKV